MQNTDFFVGVRVGGGNLTSDLCPERVIIMPYMIKNLNLNLFSAILLELHLWNVGIQST